MSDGSGGGASANAAIAAAAAIAAKISAALGSANAASNGAGAASLPPGFSAPAAAAPSAPFGDLSQITDPVERARMIAKSLIGGAASGPVAGVKRPREEDGPFSMGGESRKRKKVYLPMQANQNWVGVFLGPRGATQKGLESDSGCRVLIRGRGSKATGDEAEDNDDLHVLLISDSDASVSFKCLKAG